MKASLDEGFESDGVELLGATREVDSGWLVVDAFDFMVHLQTEEHCHLSTRPVMGGCDPGAVHQDDNLYNRLILLCGCLCSRTNSHVYLSRIYDGFFEH